MVDAEDLGFLEIGGEDGIQGAGGFQVIADRFLDHNPRPFPVTRQPGLAEVFWDFAEHARRRGHVKDAVDFGAPFLFQLRALFAQGRIGLQLLEIALLVADMPGKLVPFAGFRHSLARELPDAVVETPAQLFVAQANAVHRDDRIIGGHASVLREVEQGRHEFPPGQVTGAAKDDEHRRFELVICFHDFSLLLPFGVKRALGIDPLIGVGSEIVALGLDEIGRQPGAAIGVEITQRNHQPRGRHPRLGRLAHHLAQIFLMLHDLARQAGIEQQVRQIMLRVKRGADVFQQRGANDAAAPPDPRHGFKIQVILVFV